MTTSGVGSPAPLFSPGHAGIAAWPGKKFLSSAKLAVPDGFCPAEISRYPSPET